MKVSQDVPYETRREQGQREGRSWAATALPEEKVQLWEAHPETNIEYYSRCDQIAGWLKQELRDADDQRRWPTLYPLLEDRGLLEMLASGDVWLAGFVDGALDVMGFKPQAD